MSYRQGDPSTHKEKIIVDQKELEAVAIGERNHFLFNKVRFEAYRLKAKFVNESALCVGGRFTITALNVKSG
ncbi:hypothetical protein J4H18_23560 [Vibrio alginolyticus]|uniref:hypothetical protein n=1 Tax=Vibrio alginolyticus TaxID=663 RepID=UPI001BD20C36|nr:hypothetical protein [Vibrio alginolyticus]MBS9866979.1 hypothetical protein [Vibrio alginolyticus]MBS9890099.1 hypothetical protein [Vibrio alginolyticus]